MSRWKKLLLGFGLLLLISQIPFAYRRYRLGQLNAAIQQVNAHRVADSPPGYGESGFVEYTGVVHVHSFLGGHSKGGFREIVAAAQANKLDFVVMTEHALAEFDTAAMTLKGLHGGVMFINGSEVNTGAGRLLVVPRKESSPERSGEQILDPKESNYVRLVAYPDQFNSWEKNYEGVEIYNVYTNARQINPFTMLFDGLWSYRSYPHLLFATFYTRPSNSINIWDHAVGKTGQKLVAIAGNDSHANIGFELTDSGGNKWFGINLDPYERSFRLVRIHVVTPLVHDSVITPERVVGAIAAGHCFIGFDIFGDTTGFRYSARDGNESKIMGDEITLDDQVVLKATLPVGGRIVLHKDGAMIHEAANTRLLEFTVKERGSYRVEAYLPQLGSPVGEQPWIISNPIYVR